MRRLLAIWAVLFAVAPTWADTVVSPPSSQIIAYRNAFLTLKDRSGAIVRYSSVASCRAALAAYAEATKTSLPVARCVATDTFTITYTAPVLTTATLTWVAPTENEDGTPLTDLAGYNVYVGTTPTTLPFLRAVTAPATGVVLAGLPAGQLYIAIRAYNTAGAESAMSNIAVRPAR